MAYGKIKTDTLVYDNSGNDVEVAISSLATGTIPTNSAIDSRADARITAATGSSVQAFDADTAKTDVAQTFTKAQRGAVVTLTSAASITIDFSLGNNFILTTGHGTISFANPSTEVAGQSGSIFIQQPTSGTPVNLSGWTGDFRFPAQTPLAGITATLGGVDRVDYVVKDANEIHCVSTLDMAS